MLFAQVGPDVASYLNVAINAGALGILGYHLLVGLPRLFDAINASHKLIVESLFGDAAADRAGFEARAKGIEEEIRQMRELVKCKYQP